MPFNLSINYGYTLCSGKIYERNIKHSHESMKIENVLFLNKLKLNTIQQNVDIYKTQSLGFIFFSVG